MEPNKSSFPPKASIRTPSRVFLRRVATERAPVCKCRLHRRGLGNNENPGIQLGSAISLFIHAGPIIDLFIRAGRSVLGN